jgi:hypothetical protein
MSPPWSGRGRLSGKAGVLSQGLFFPVLLKKWHWALGTIGIIILILILVQGVGERSVSYLSIIPARELQPVS